MLPEPVSTAPGAAVERLRAKAVEAAQLRACQTDPDVVALAVEQVGQWFDRLLWSGIGVGLAFTTTNVQAFAAHGAAAWSLAWLAAWLLDPTVSLILVAMLLAEQVISRAQIPTPPWTHVTKGVALVATYTMNTWQSWAAADAGQIVLHSVPVIVVFAAVQAAPELRHCLTEAVRRAAEYAAKNAPAPVQEAPAVPSMNGSMDAPVSPVVSPIVNARPAFMAAVHGSADERPAPSTTNGAAPRRRSATTATRRPAKRSPSKGAPRKLLADYVADARAAYTPGVDVTPAWVRDVTDCSRGLSPKVAASLLAEVEEMEVAS